MPGFSITRSRWSAIAPIVAGFLLAGGASASGQQQTARRQHDVFGGISSSRIVVQLKREALDRPALRQMIAAAGRNADPSTALSARTRTAAANWRVQRMRPVFSDFGDPQSAKRYELDRRYILEVPPGTDTEAMAAAFAALNEDVESATVDTIGGVADAPVIPVDTNFGVQWGLHNTGQTVQGQSGIADADIDAVEAWKLHTGDLGTVTVAIIDSGVDSHVEYGTNEWPTITGRIVRGANTANELTPDYTLDDCPHGTHVAGIVAAGGNNGRCSSGSVNPNAPCVTTAECPPGCIGGINTLQPCVTQTDCPGGTCGVPTCIKVGVAGVTWGAYIMPVRVLLTNSPCAGTVADLQEGIRWAADHGADIGNMSLQYYGLSSAEYTSLQNTVNYAHDRGMLLVAATGNGQCNTVVCGGPCCGGIIAYPARLLNSMAVGATTNRDQVATTPTAGWFSNTGTEIDISAPGDDIYSTWMNNSYTYLFGTSMATPHVSGVAALVKSYVPDLTPDDLYSILIGSADDIDVPGWDPRSGSGRLNAHKALLLGDIWHGVLSSDPPEGSIDAGKPTDPDGTNVYGWQTIELTYGRIASPPSPADFQLTQLGGIASPPAVVDVLQLNSREVLATLDGPIRPLGWTTIAHTATGTSTRLGFLPGDVDSNGVSEESDVQVLVQLLIDPAHVKPVWSLDITRDGAVTPADLLEVVDLLNGAGAYDPYLGATLP